jgi:hypothetical protein
MKWPELGSGHVAYAYESLLERFRVIQFKANAL